jgi:hypothetical protein
MALKTYYPDQVALVAAGVPCSGFMDGTFITVEYNEEAFALTTGVDRESCRTRLNDNSARFTFTLMQTSDSNALLSALHTLDKNSPNGDGIAPSFVKDNSGTTLAAAETSWIVKSAPIVYAKEVQGREWVVETDFLTDLVGGN